MITVLLTGAGAPGMPGILKCLKKVHDQIRLIGADADAQAPSRRDFDSFHRIPMAKEPEFISAMVELCKEEEVDLLVPVVTRELIVLAQNRKKIESNGTRVAVMEKETLRIANNKGLLFQKLEENDIEVPSYRITKTVLEIKEAMDEISQNGVGVVVKPVEGNGSRGVRIVDKQRSAFDSFFSSKPDGMNISQEELLRILSEKEHLPQDMMVMSFLPGKEYSVDIVARDGQVLVAVCRVGLQVVSSNQTSSMVVDEPEIVELCTRVVGLLRLSGNIGFDLKEDENGKAYILEINPRLTGGIVTCLAAGANMPWLGIQSWLGEKVEQPKLLYGVKMQRYWNESFFDPDDQAIEV